ncbi:integrase core domain-containing protein [Corynebacterium otitidis]|uniref:integrase core domain-containing protein n=2 Tax=Corynebacterium otitidis TaxID=29321 RepID=UPI0009E43657
MLEDQGISHKCTRAYRPQTNGKDSRFNRTPLAESAHVDNYNGETARARRYPGWLHDYNHHRPHHGLGGLYPVKVVYDFTGKLHQGLHGISDSDARYRGSRPGQPS